MSRATDLFNLANTVNAALPEQRLSVLQAALAGIPDPEERELFETAFMLGLSAGQGAKPSDIVLLIHGIRTHATWQDRLAHQIAEESDLKVIPIGYGYLDVMRFICPFVTRQGPINRVLRELRTVRTLNPLAKISVVAHSFGTYIISEILAEETDVKIHRLQLCGSIIKTGYRWDKVISRVSGAVVNDSGTRDVWPVFANSVSWGYGPSGTFGFKTAVVTDRYYDCGHSDFFDNDHMREYWLPLLVDGRVVPSAWSNTRPAPSGFVTALNVLPIKCIIGLIAVIVAFLYFR